MVVFGVSEISVQWIRMLIFFHFVFIYQIHISARVYVNILLKFVDIVLFHIALDYTDATHFTWPWSHYGQRKNRDGWDGGLVGAEWVGLFMSKIPPNIANKFIPKSISMWAHKTHAITWAASQHVLWNYTQKVLTNCHAISFCSYAAVGRHICTLAGVCLHA